MLVLFFIVVTLADRWIGIETKHHPDGMRLVTTVAGYNVYERIGNKRMTIPTNLTLDVKKQQFKRYFKNGVTDPLFRQQWHLTTVLDSWSESTGLGIPIAIVDDGVQWNHPDIFKNYNASLSYDFNGHDSNPMPVGDDAHGTACAGVAAAVRNMVCGRGVAYGASIVGVRLVASPVYDYEEAQAISHHRDKIRIYSCSWGPEDSGEDMIQPGQVMRAALKQGFESGQSIFVWAGGNGRHVMDNSNYDGYANSAYTFAIGAIDYSGSQSYYSESGANLLCVTPSSGVSGRSITTTDLMGAHGYNSFGECTSSFGGTSSSAPLAAGIIARMLQRRPDLSTRDVQHIIAKHATKVHGNWSTVNRRGYTHSNQYGFGLLTIMNDTILSNWVRVSSSLVHISTTVNVPNLPMDTIVHVNIPASLSFVERVLITVSMTHSRRGQVHVSISSPFTTSVLSEHRKDIHSGAHTWTYSSLRHWGEDLNVGDVWNVSFKDDTKDAYVGTVQRVTVEWMGMN